MKRRTILIPAFTVVGVGLLAMGTIDDKVISSRGSLFLNIDADNNEAGQLLEIARDTAGGGVGGTPLVTVLENGFVGIGTTTPTNKLTVADGSLEVDLPDIGFAPLGSKITLSTPAGRPGIGIVKGDGSGGVARRYDFLIETDNSLRFRDVAANFDAIAIKISGFVGIGTTVPTSRLHVNGATTTNVLTILGGADIVEGFNASDDTIIEPGTVVVIDPANPGTLMTSTETYDLKVAGVVSGANGVNPGIHLGQDSVMDGDVKVAMTGRVYVKSSTENGPIRPGDRLTTAALAGHAMKATDSTRSDGAVIGKAMSSLDDETGLVLVLVNLQ